MRFTDAYQLASRTLDILLRHPINKSELTIRPHDLPADWQTDLLARILNHPGPTTPSIEQLDLDPDDTHRAIFLPLGEARWLPDMQAHLVEWARRRRISLALAHAATAIDRGADPDMVLAGLAERGAA